MFRNLLLDGTDLVTYDYRLHRASIRGDDVSGTTEFLKTQIMTLMKVTVAWTV